MILKILVPFLIIGVLSVLVFLPAVSFLVIPVNFPFFFGYTLPSNAPATYVEPVKETESSESAKAVSESGIPLND